MSDKEKKAFNGDITKLQKFIKELEAMIIYSSEIEDIDLKEERDPLVMHLTKAHASLNNYLINKYN